MSKPTTLACCLLFCLYRAAQAGPAPLASPVYKWTDTQGQAHYSDSAPGYQASKTIDLDDTQPGQAKGLRPGELATLRTIDRRRQLRHKAAESARHAQRRARTAHRQDCSDARAKLRRSRNHATSKAWSRYLREHCW